MLGSWGIFWSKSLRNCSNNKSDSSTKQSTEPKQPAWSSWLLEQLHRNIHSRANRAIPVPWVLAVLGFFYWVLYCSAGTQEGGQFLCWGAGRYSTSTGSTAMQAGQGAEFSAPALQCSAWHPDLACCWSQWQLTGQAVRHGGRAAGPLLTLPALLASRASWRSSQEQASMSGFTTFQQGRSPCGLLQRLQLQLKASF